MSDERQHFTGDGRRGRPFTLRLEDGDRARLEELSRQVKRDKYVSVPVPGRMKIRGNDRYGALGPFIVWAALQWRPPIEVVPARRRVGTTGTAAGGKTRRRVSK